MRRIRFAQVPFRTGHDEVSMMPAEPEVNVALLSCQRRDVHIAERMKRPRNMVGAIPGSPLMSCISNDKSCGDDDGGDDDGDGSAGGAAPPRPPVRGGNNHGDGGGGGGRIAPPARRIRPS